ncbi:2-amino-4-hydroxy-6-hydroxymethyldihydropteridine diphosphokinase [Nitrospina gracilis]|uniref:2-amino-4-hydroxy-6- hydroxymethyldihydropteridine diphosphokinase n=1 Tax=Nitrospina gracilis TaxID=35801 RepID=UPI001F0323C1|nr:2-amino-4-hydroxy-6-hydroxymethyldihydropteridine diphosphokinase [Nitrospina gracilis]MCF8720887.1 2-amino-4-hydroxy-6-hydroxymethyldihydropteridine diphosphokinase [Nitrospina gracilis Nb-211]
MSRTAIIGIGSNMGDAPGHCREAIDRMRAHPALTLRAASSLYQTQPYGKTDQDWFINAVAQVETDLSPADLLKTLLGIEKEMGRERREKWGPRTIDLDLLLYDAEIIEEKDLQVPHPGIAERRFVLEPLAEIAPDRIHPTLNKSIADLLAEVQDDLQVTRLPNSA